MMQEKVLIKTNQPYLVFATEQFKQRVIATYGISHFYSYKPSNTNQSDMYLIPDGCSNIIFAYNNSNMEAYVLGSVQKKEPIKLDSTREYFGVRFQPGENPCFAKESVKGFVNETNKLKDFSQMNSLYSGMDQIQSFNERINTFLQIYNKSFCSENDTKQHDLFRQIYILIVKTKGIITISELEKRIGYSARYINLLFTEKLGISAKQFCRIIKFQNAVDLINKGYIDNLCNLAEKFDYYDQSHFIHDFKNFTNKTPSNYLKTIKNSQYRSRVVDM
jgi:AraC-like DNA-binding protein